MVFFYLWLRQLGMAACLVYVKSYKANNFLNIYTHVLYTYIYLLHVVTLRILWNILGTVSTQKL